MKTLTPKQESTARCVPLDEPKGWIDFWNHDQFWTYPELFFASAKLVCKNAISALQLTEKDDVLDIGCGPGFSARLLAPKVASILAVDTSRRFVQLCEENNRGRSNVEVRALDQDYTNLDFDQKKFSVFLCVSVVQYYRNINEVESLILSAKKVALPGARMLIADMPRKPSWMRGCWDGLCSLNLAIKEKCLGTLIGKAFKEWRRIMNYRKCSKRLPHLYLDEKDLSRLAHKLNLKSEIVKEDFSICANRLNILIHFD